MGEPVGGDIPTLEKGVVNMKKGGGKGENIRLETS